MALSEEKCEKNSGLQWRISIFLAVNVDGNQEID